MRSNYVLAGLTAVAALSAASGIRFVAARVEPWPPPAILVAPDAARLASGVNLETFSATLLTRIKRFNSKPLRGSLDAFGKDRLKVWDWIYLARSAVCLYHLNHDPRLIQAVLDGAQAYETDAHRHEALEGFGWYTEDTAAHSVYREVSVTGLIIAPVIDLLLASASDPQLSVQIETKRAWLLELVRRGIAGLDRRYIEEAGRGYYLLPAGDDIEPINLMSVYATPLLGYWRLTGDGEALREAMGIARTWKAALSIAPDGSVTWPHTARPSSIPATTNPAESLIKAAAAIEFPLAAYLAGLVLERKDIEALAAAPMTTLLQQVDDSHYLLREMVQAHLDRYVVVQDPKARSTALRPSAWYSYLCYDRRLTAALDPYLFGLDPKFYLHDDIAMLGMAERLVIEGDPQTCAVRANDAQARAGSAAGTVASAAADTGTTRSILR